MKKQSTMTIGALAKTANVGVETIRFYERKGIIQQPPKRGGFRYYNEGDARRIQLVKKLQDIGFTLEEVKEFLLTETCCGETKTLIAQKSKRKIAEITAKIEELQIAVSALEKFANACGAEGNISFDCELLDCFENDWACCTPDDQQVEKVNERRM